MNFSQSLFSFFQSLFQLLRSIFIRAFNPQFLLMLSFLGPGLVVMLADTDAGSIITAAQSGAVWGYRLLILQMILIPILFFAQDKNSFSESASH